MFNDRTASHLVASAAEAIEADPAGFGTVLDTIPAAIYVTDPEGTVTYFNPACVELAGRTPQVGADKWCVTWKLYTTEGEFLPHQECPMAVAIKERAPVRDVEAIAERPDGSRITFVPYPTPLFDAAGEFAGAVNLLQDVTRQRRPEFMLEQADRCRRLARGVTDFETVEALTLMAQTYIEQARKLADGEPRPA